MMYVTTRYSANTTSTTSSPPTASLSTSGHSSVLHWLGGMMNHHLSTLRRRDRHESLSSMISTDTYVKLGTALATLYGLLTFQHIFDNSKSSSE